MSGMVFLVRLIVVTLQKEAQTVDKDTFAAEAEAAAGLLYRVACTLLRNDTDCQDAVQEALMKAWAGREKLRNLQFFRTWITRILINTCHDMLRKKRFTVSMEEIPEQGAEFPDPVLSDALARLPEKFSLPLMLCYSENMSYEEIGKALRLPVTTVQSRLRRGKIQLRKELEAHEK